MSTKLTTLCIPTLFLALGCSGDDAGNDTPIDAGAADSRSTLTDAASVDAQPADFGCDVANVPDPVVLAGATEDLIGSNDAPGVTLEVFPVGAAKPILTTVSDLDGNYSLDIPTGGTSWVGEIRTTSPDYITAHIYPSGLSKSLSLDIPVLSPSARMLAGTLAEVEISDTDSIVMAIIIDCNEDEVIGATISTDLASGTQTYLTSDAPFLDGDATETGDSGAAIILKAEANVQTPGKAKVMAAYKGRTWEVTVDVIPGDISFAIFLP